MKELYKDKLNQIANDEVLLASLGQLIAERIEKSKPKIENENNEHIGEKYRAYIEAKTIFDNLINDIKAFKTIHNKKVIKNRAR